MDSVALICERGRFSPDCGTLLVIYAGRALASTGSKRSLCDAAMCCGQEAAVVEGGYMHGRRREEEGAEETSGRLAV
jgi:hypothetical protein